MVSMEPWGNTSLAGHEDYPKVKEGNEKEVESTDQFWQTPWTPADTTESLPERNQTPTACAGGGMFASDSNHLRMLEGKLNRLKRPAHTTSKSMLSALKLAKEDFMKNHINEESHGHSFDDEENTIIDQTFFDKLYSTNVLYRHLFPENQALGTLEKQPLLEKWKVSQIEDGNTDNQTNSYTNP